MGQQTRHLMDEADIGSGEKTAGQKEVEHEERSVPANRSDTQQQPHRSNDSSEAGNILRNGTHLARIVAVEQSDGTYEAQVYVRLTREPEVAETYIPAGTYATEAEAWTAAEERARRAFTEKEF